MLDAVRAAARNFRERALSFFTPAIVRRLKERELRLAALTARPRLTSAAILAADFGTDCPAGLSIRSYPGHAVRLFPLTAIDGFDALPEEDRRRMLAAPIGCAGEDERIFLHPAYFDPARRGALSRLFALTLPHEHVHRLQAEERDTGWASAFAGETMRFLDEEGERRGATGAAGRLYTAFRRAVLERRVMRGQDGPVLSVSGYYISEPEVQARLHQILALGYVQWGRMPATATELRAALTGLGVKAPRAVRRALRADPAGRQAMRDFRSGFFVRRAARDIVHELNFVHGYAALPGKRRILWDSALPALYGNLLELYGDGPGRARMGRGENPEAARAVLRALHAKGDAHILPLRPAHHLARAVRPAHAGSLRAVILRHFPPDAPGVRAVLDSLPGPRGDGRPPAPAFAAARP